MIAAIIFSRDRACQLDLLLRSMLFGGVTPFDPVTVIYRATDDLHGEAYSRVRADYRDREIDFVDEQENLPAQARELLEDADLACFLTDDSVFYRQPIIPDSLGADDLCHSFRLGRNTTWCYPHARGQTHSVKIGPSESAISWRWQGADGDFGYPASLDGHVFRASHLRRALLTCREDANPNRIEEHLDRRVRARLAKDYPLMTAEVESSLVGIPVNRVNQTNPNRYGDRYPVSAGDLLERYLAGERLSLDGMDFSDVRGAHQEIELVFE